MSKSSNPDLTVDIAPFDLSDAHELACVAVQSSVDTYGYHIPEGKLEHVVEADQWVERFEQASIEDSILVAKLAGKIIGYAQYGDFYPPGMLSPDAKELRKLYLATGMKGRGIGRQLMEAAMQSDVLRSAPQVGLWVWGGNQEAINFYARNDFRGAFARRYMGSDRRPTFDLMMVRDQAAPPSGE